MFSTTTIIIVPNEVISFEFKRLVWLMLLRWYAVARNLTHHIRFSFNLSPRSTLNTKHANSFLASPLSSYCMSWSDSEIIHLKTHWLPFKYIYNKVRHYCIYNYYKRNSNKRVIIHSLLASAGLNTLLQVLQDSFIQIAAAEDHSSSQRHRKSSLGWNKPPNYNKMSPFIIFKTFTSRVVWNMNTAFWQKHTRYWTVLSLYLIALLVVWIRAGYQQITSLLLLYMMLLFELTASACFL